MFYESKPEMTTKLLNAAFLVPTRYICFVYTVAKDLSMTNLLVLLEREREKDFSKNEEEGGFIAFRERAEFEKMIRGRTS